MRAKKSLGQYFLICQWAVDALMRAAQLMPDDTVLEIGPGTGILTRAIAPRVKKLIAVEKDERLTDILGVALNREGIGNVNIVKGDILDLFRPPQTLPQTKFRSGYDLNLVWGRKNSYKMVANIPYYLTSHLLRVVLETGPKPEQMVLTVQKEVAQRIVAKPPKMNLLALSVQAFGAAKIIKIVPKECFSPKPKVDSAIIAISDISDDFFSKNSIGTDDFFKIIRTAFGQKRKQLINTLAHIAGDKKTALEILRAAAINPKIRPEQLTLAQWATLVKRLTNSSRP